MRMESMEIDLYHAYLQQDALDRPVLEEQDGQAHNCQVGRKAQYVADFDAARR